MEKIKELKEIFMHLKDRNIVILFPAVSRKWCKGSNEKTLVK